MADDAVERMQAFLNVWRGLNKEIQAQTIATFLQVAHEPGITMTRLQEKLGISQASTSRNVAYLSKMYRPGEPGFDLVRAEEDPMNRRQKIVELTPKGERFLQTLKDVMH